MVNEYCDKYPFSSLYCLLDSYSPSGSTEIVIFFLAAEIYCDLGALARCMNECAKECGIDNHVMSITLVIVVQF